MHFQKPMLGVPLDWSNHLNDGLVMHLAMNEGHGDKLQDLSLNGNHGAINNMAFPSTVASGWNPGRTGVGLNFAGDNDHVNCGNAASLNTTGDRSISNWLKTTSANDQKIISSDDGASPAPLLYNLDTSGGLPRTQIRDSGGNIIAISSAEAVNDGQWHHFITILESKTLKLYIDGIEKNSDTNAALNPANTVTVADIYIGQRAGAANRFTGSIDQVRIHNRALTAKEVQDYYINPWQVYLDEEGM